MRAVHVPGTSGTRPELDSPACSAPHSSPRLARWGWWETAIAGDVVKAPGARFTARVKGGEGRQLLIVANGQTVATVPVTSDDFVHRFKAAGPGRWRLQLMSGSLVQTVSSPIWVEPGRGGVQRERC